MKNNTLIILLFLIAIVQNGLAQGWERTITPTTSEEVSYTIKQTADGGYILGGAVSLNQFGAAEHSLIKLNHRGETQWQRTTSMNFMSSTIYDLKLTPDGGYIVAGGRRISGGNYNDAFLEKYDNLGNAQWMQVYTAAGTGGSAATEVELTPDGGYILSGSDQGKMLLLKTDSTGIMTWQKRLGTAINEGANSIEILPNNTGYILGGVEQVPSNQWLTKLVRVDMQGDTIWTKTYGSSGSIYMAGTVVLAPDGGFALTSNSNADIYVVKTDSSGNLEWEHTFGGSTYVDFGSDIQNTLDSGFVITGETYINPSSSKLFLLKLDAQGNTVWEKKYGSFGDRWQGHAVQALPDSGYVACGFRGAAGNNQRIIYAVKTDADGELYSSTLKGHVYYDQDSTCTNDSTDYPLAGRLVYAIKDSTTYVYGMTDSAGFYEFRLDTGIYEVRLADHYKYAYYDNASCVPDTFIKNIFFVGYTATADFPQAATVHCPLVEVNIGTALLRRCFTSYYNVSYCNHGTLDAINTEIEVRFDPFLSVDTTSLAFPFTNIGNNSYVFVVDTIGLGTCGSFTIPVYVDCDSTVIGQTHCVEVETYPDTNCLVPAWPGPNIQLNAICTGDSIQFTISNIGSSMSSPLNYYVYEDNVMVRMMPFQLNSGQSQVEYISSNGATYRIEAQQQSGFPSILGNSLIAVLVQHCNTQGSGSTGFVTIFPNLDGSPFFDIDCTENIGSYDPNDKRGFPKGYGAQHYIEQTTGLDYNIRFQNTGTDTAFSVVIIDTIAPELDLTSIQFGASSHNYSVHLSGEEHQIVEFAFNNIQLPDSNTNEAASHGFVQFTIDQKANNPLGTVINNQAAIYFDYNAPIFTNTTFHTIGEDFVEIQLISTESIADEADIRVKVMPNPFQSNATILVEGINNTEPLTLEVYNMVGQQVRRIMGNQNKFALERDNLQAGIYVFRIREEDKLHATGKFIVK